MATLQSDISTFRSTQSEGHQGLLSKLQIGSNLYDIKDPAVEELAAKVETRLAAVEGKSWTAVSKGAETKKYATVVEQGTNGSITVTYSNLRDTALTDSATTGQFITSVSQDVDGVVTTTKGGVAAENVTFAASNGVDLSATNVKAAIEEVLADAMALKGTSSATASDETIAGAKAYADAAVQALAGQDWTAQAQKVQDIIDELEGSEQATQWSTLVDKLKGMSVSAKGQQGDPDYRAANANPTVVEYVQAAIEDVNAANAAGIADLDAIVYGADGAAGATGATATTNYAGDTTHKVAIKVTEVDGVITAIDVKTNDVASASDLTTLDGTAVKSVNGATGNSVTLYAGDIALTSSDNTTVAAKLTSLDSNKANKAGIATGTVNDWGTPSYTAGTETLAWSSSSVSVLVPGSGTL